MLATSTTTPPHDRLQRVRSALTALCLAPWYASPVQIRWFTGPLLLAGSLGALALDVTQPGLPGGALGLFCYAFVIVFWWQYGMSNLVLLVHDARAIATPSLARYALASAVLYGAATLLAPAIAAWLTDRSAALAVLGSALAASAGFTFMPMPRLASIVLAGAGGLAYISKRRWERGNAWLFAGDGAVPLTSIVMCGSIWLAWCAGAALAARYATRRLARRPHPFLPGRAP